MSTYERSHPVGEEWVDPVFGRVRRIPKPTPWQLPHGTWLMKREEAARRIREDDLATFEGWLRYQAIDAATATPEELENWRSIFDEVRESAAAIPKVGRMKLRPLVPDEHRYAVAVREGSDLWLTLWVRVPQSRSSSSSCHAAIGVGTLTLVITATARCIRRASVTSLVRKSASV